MSFGGANLPLIPAAELLGIGTIRAIAGVSQNQFGSFVGPWRPPQWQLPALTTVTVPAPYVQAKTGSTSGISAVSSQPGSADAAAAGSQGQFTMSVNVPPAPPANAQPIIYVFDGVLRLHHSQRATPSRIPVQTLSNLTDHVMLDPAVLSMDVIMSDVMDSYTAGQWQGNPSKSISCFQVLDNLRASRIPLTVTTRLKTYTNCFITDLPTEDTVRTRHGLRLTVMFEQIFVASVATQSISARPQTTDSNELGSTQADTVPAGVVSNNMLPSASTGIPSSSAIQQNLGSMPGAGNWSSNSTATLPPADFKIGEFGLPVPN
jgi:hypothetical protein